MVIDRERFLEPVRGAPGNLNRDGIGVDSGVVVTGERRRPKPTRESESD